MESLGDSSRKEKRKEAKKLKRKQIRKETALKERAELEALLNDPEEQLKIELKEQEEADLLERERKEFEERERLWIARKAEEEARRKLIEEESKRNQVELKNNLDEDEDIDDDWEYVEEGPAEIIWQGNEIIVKKKKVRVAKKTFDRQSIKEDDERPTSNPFPPQSSASAQQVLDSVAQQVPNFGTEQDKAHCPFHIKTGACRFGSRCSRVHFYPDKSCTLLIKNMYNGPGLAWEQDEGLEFTDEEVERCFEEFYEDVHTEFLKYGEVINFKVCRNGSFHLRGNVYVHYKALESAILAYNSINGRYFAGKQITCEFVSVTRWKVAICGEYMKTRLKTCSHGTACNFIHCFRNPGGDYEWADWDKRPPKYWVKKMLALFGPSDESYEKEVELENRERSNSSNWKRTVTSGRYWSRKSTSREMDYYNSGFGDVYHEINARRHSHSIRKPHSNSRREDKFLSDEHRRSEEKYNSDEHKYKRKRRALDHGSGGEYSDGSREKCSRHSMAFSRRQEKEAGSDHSSRREGSCSIKREAEFSDESLEFRDENNFYDQERYDQKRRFHDCDSELEYSDENTGKLNRYSSRKECLAGSEMETDLPDEQRKSKDKYNFDNSVRCEGRYSGKNRSGCSDRSTRRAHSNRWKCETNSLDMKSQGKENHESRYEKHRVHEPEHVNKKRKSRKQEANKERFAAGTSCGDQNEEESNSSWENVSLQTALDDCGNSTVNFGDTRQDHHRKHRSKSSKRERRHRKEEFEKDTEVETTDSNANNLKSEKSVSRKRLRSRSPFQDSGR